MPDNITPTLELDGLRAVVSGSTRGLGAAIARDLTARGARLVINGTDRTACEQLAAELDAVAVCGSVATEETATALVERCVEAYDGIDLLVNNAGVTRDGLLHKLPADAFDDVIGVHLRGGWLATRAAVRAMGSGGGSIVNVVSGTALFGNVGQSTYAAAKGGLLSLTRSLSIELASRGIRVNAISPIAHTTMIEPLLTLAGAEREAVKALFGAPAEVATIVSFLASDAAADLTGQVLGFDGRELTVWSHPVPLRRARRERPWSLDQFAETLAAGERAQLHADALGEAVLRLLKVTQ